jgi:chitodextrinase
LAVTGYNVYEGSTLVGSTQNTSYTATGLSANTAYSFTVKAKDAAGNLSSASNTLNITTDGSDTQAPTAPTNLVSTGKTDSSVSLSWTASNYNVGVTGYSVFNGTNLAGSVTDTSAMITGLTAGTAYSFTVKAEDAAGNLSSASNTLMVTTDGADTQAPTAPTNLASTGKTDTSVSLSWTASTDDTGVTSYNLYNSGVFLNSTSDTHMDLTGLSPNTAYTFTIKAEDASGNESSASNSVNVTTDPSASVTHTTLHPSADSYVRDGTDLNTNFGTALSLNVKQGASGHSHETYLKFDLSGISGTISEANLRINGSWNNSSNTNVPINAYSVSNTSWTETGITWSNKPSAGTTVLASATVIDETPQWYELDLTSYIQAEKSAGHNTVSVALKGSQQTESIGIFNSDEDSSDQPELVVTANTDIVSPTAPSNLSSTGKTKTSVSLTWTASTDNTGVTGYRILQDGAFTGSTTGTSFTADGLSPNTAYAFTVKAVDAAGNESAASNTVNVTTDSDTSATTILSASADAFVHDGSDSDVNFGSSQVLHVKNGAGDGNHRETYLAFDLSSLSGSINEAKLRLYGSWNNTTNSNIAVNAYSVTDSWDESELTWDNKPAAGASIIASTVIIDTTPRWYEWDLTSYIQGQLSAQNDTANVVLTGSQQTGSIALFHSAENPSNKPQLLVTVNTDNQSPTVPSSLSTTGKTTTSVDLTWTAATDNVGVTGYNIYRDAVSAGTSTGTSFTASGLSANTTYAFTVTAVDAADNESAASNSINVTTNNTTTTVLSAAADAYVHDGTDSGTNFGSSSILDVKSGASSGNNRETYLKFDLSSLSGSINGATLRLYGAWNNGTNSNVDVNAYSVSNTTWTESGLTWNNKPAAGATLLDSATITDTTQRWYEWDLTSYIQAEKSAGHNTVCIVLTGSQQTSSIAVFQSDEASSNQPQLVISQ